jgi:hypothetical protein
MRGAAVVLAAVLAARAGRAEPVTQSVTVTVGASTLVLGIDQETELHIETDADAAALPRVVASTGRIEDLARTGPRSFAGRYVLPAERFPQAALLVAEVAAGETLVRGYTVVRLRAAASPAFHTDPGAAVTFRVGEKEFGPQVAPKDGWVRVPVVVPPGVNFGVARSVNQFGVATEETIDLKTPPFRQVLLVGPEVFAAGAVREVAVYAVDRSGTPVESAEIALRLPSGRPQPLGGRPGEARFLLRAPPGPGPFPVQALLRSDPSTAVAADIAVVPGPPARLVMSPDRGRLPIGEGSSMRVYLTAEDQFGNATDAARTAVLVDGAPVELRPAPDGRMMAVVPAPTEWRGRDHVEVEAALGSAYTAQRIALGNVPAPARQQSPDAMPRLTVTPRLGLLLTSRQPPGASLLLEALARGQTWPEWFVLGATVGLLATEISASDWAGVSNVSVQQIPLLLIARYQRRVQRRLLVGLDVGLGATWAQARVRSFGRSIPGQGLAPAATLGAETAVRLPPGQVVLGARYVLVSIGRLSSGDRLLGNSGGLIADLGYRLAW